MNPFVANMVSLVRLGEELQLASQGLVDDAMAERGAGWIRELERELPLAYRLLMSMLYSEPPAVMKALISMVPDLAGLRDSPGVLAYIAQVQGVLRRKRK